MLVDCSLLEVSAKLVKSPIPHAKNLSISQCRFCKSCCLTLYGSRTFFWQENPYLTLVRQCLQVLWAMRQDITSTCKLTPSTSSSSNRKTTPSRLQRPEELQNGAIALTLKRALRQGEAEVSLDAVTFFVYQGYCTLSSISFWWPYSSKTTQDPININVSVHTKTLAAVTQLGTLGG